MPNPAPNSNSCDVNNCWKVQGASVGSSTGSGNSSGGASPMPPMNNGGQKPDMMAPMNAQPNVNIQNVNAPGVSAPVAPMQQGTPKPVFVPPMNG
jgi:hypothetical protein